MKLNQQTSIIKVIPSTSIQARRRRAARITNRLVHLYNSPRLNNKDDPLDELYFILLSQMTTSPSYERVFNHLHEVFPSWELLTDVSLPELCSVISEAGLTNQKAPRFIEIARRLKEDFGKVTLDPLLAYTDDQAEAFLASLPGVGLKTAKCVMMYTMGRTVLPVDTHVARVARRFCLLNWDTPSSRWHSDLEAVVVPDHRYNFHVNAVAHGRAICRARFPSCSICGVKSLCPTGRNANFEPMQVTQLTAVS